MNRPVNEFGALLQSLAPQEPHPLTSVAPAERSGNVVHGVPATALGTATPKATTGPNLTIAISCRYRDGFCRERADMAKHA